MIVLYCLLLTACTSTPDTKTSATPSILPGKATTTPKETDATVAEPVKFTLHTPNEALDGFTETEVEVEELSVLSIVQKLTETGVLNEGVTVNSKTTEDLHLSIDLNTEYYDQLMRQGSTRERFLMGNVGQLPFWALWAPKPFLSPSTVRS